jgi:hypothetical protein
MALPSVREKPRYMGRYQVIKETGRIKMRYPPAEPVSALSTTKISFIPSLTVHSLTHPPSELPAMSRSIHPTRLRIKVAARASHWVYSKVVTR